MTSRHWLIVQSIALLLSGPLSAQTAMEQNKRDSVAASGYIAKIRKAENGFLADWRYEWRKWRDLKGTDPRYWSLHCHYDDYEVGDEFHVISTMASSKSMCPIWYQGEGQRADENDGIDNG